MSVSKKAAFVRHLNPDEFVRTQRHGRCWMSHSVALLVLSPRADHIVVVLPRKAKMNNSQNTRVPPQRSLGRNEPIIGAAGAIGREVLSGDVFADTDLQYIGTGRGSACRRGIYDPYGKWIHWVGLKLTARRSFSGSNTVSDIFSMIHWCTPAQFMSMDRYAMSERKHMLTLQALAGLHALGVAGKMTLRAVRQI